jgi:hypothetical protein
MRIDKYFERIQAANDNKKTDPKKVARMIERTLRKVATTPKGQEAIKIVQMHLAKKHIRAA